MKKLHQKQKKLLEILKKNISSPLTLEEMALQADITAPSIVHHHLKQLEKKGFLKRNPYNPKDYQIISKPENSVVYINLYGKVVCNSNGLKLEDKPIDCIPISSKLINCSSENAFMIEAVGDSMEPKIYEKDLVIAQKNSSPENNAIVVCVHGREVKIKKFLKSNSQIILISLNIKYEPIIINKKNLDINDNDFCVVGEVKGVIKRSI